MGADEGLPVIETPPGARFVLDTGRRCTVCLSPLFGDPGSITINKEISIHQHTGGAAVTLSFPVCTVCVDSVPPHHLHMERWKLARPGPEMSITVFEHRGVIRELLASGVESYYSRADGG